MRAPAASRGPEEGGRGAGQGLGHQHPARSPERAWAEGRDAPQAEGDARLQAPPLGQEAGRLTKKVPEQDTAGMVRGGSGCSPCPPDSGVSTLGALPERGPASPFSLR